MKSEFARYFLVSMFALLLDMGLLLLLARVMHYALAATASFMIGAVVHYLLSIRFVFERRRMEHRKWLEGGVYVTIGLVALVVNDIVIIACVEWFVAPLWLAKMVAAGFSFLIGYVARKASLFR